MKYKNIPYNLYELLGVSSDESIENINISFRNLIKQFHPDKISEKEEEIYYYLVEAKNILSDKRERKLYDDFLSKSNFNSFSNNFNNLSNNFNSLNVREYLPPSKKEASKRFLDFSSTVQNRHGFIDEGDINKNLEEKSKELDANIFIEKECKNIDQLNEKFVNKKRSKEYDNRIIKYDKKIQPYKTKDKSKYSDLGDFNKLYLEDSVNTNNFTSLDRAFLLHPEIDVNTISSRDTTNNRDKLSSNRFNFNAF